MQFFLKSQNFGLNPDRGSISNSTSDKTALPTRVLPGFNFLVGMEADPRLILSALHSVTDVKILSTPSLVVVDNQVASLLVGDQIPITTRTAQSVDVPTAPIERIDYRSTGVICGLHRVSTSTETSCRHRARDQQCCADRHGRDTDTDCRSAW